ncbi:hypothetical protein [Nonomuraea sp. KM90]|uniref:hypothetical protein n=1 Tax=Nonomuraea sp. KM90 TaxID=3457428 RepID=UPI003FCDA83E
MRAKGLAYGRRWAGTRGGGTLTGRLPTTAQVVDAAVFLLENQAINGVGLRVDGGVRER